MAYEDTYGFAVWSPNMATAIMAINQVGCFHLLMHMVPADNKGYWLLFKMDSWLQARWKENFPDAVTLPN